MMSRIGLLFCVCVLQMSATTRAVRSVKSEPATSRPPERRSQRQEDALRRDRAERLAKREARQREAALDTGEIFRLDRLAVSQRA